MARDYFYTANSHLTESLENITFHQAHMMSDVEFFRWVDKLKKRVRDNWKRYEVPAASGCNTEVMITEALQHLSSRSVDDCLIRDHLTYRKDCLINRTKTSSVINNYFPTMWKTIDTSVGVSAYDLFHTDKQENRVKLLFRRHFTRDGYYLYTEFVKNNEQCLVEASSGKEWIMNFKNKRATEYSNYDFFIDGKLLTPDKSKTVITKSELLMLRSEGYVKQRHLNKIEAGMNGSRIKFNDCSDDQLFYIRYYDKSLKLFPRGHRVFRGAMNIDATNFSAFVAKYIWLTYTDKFKNDEVICYDPALGWGGRLAGALAASSQRKNMTYVGTDTNPDMWIEQLNMTRYEYFAEHYKLSVSQPNYAKLDFFDCGSEEIHQQKRFQKYKGRICCAFTSPQYWTSEIYSLSEKQSAIKYPEYSDWVSGFLEPTIRTTAEYLTKGGSFLLNIADVSDPHTNRMMPLENDSIDLLQKAGLKLVKKYKYVLGKPPGAGKIGKSHKRPTYKNFIELSGQFRKVEPIYVAQKL